MKDFSSLDLWINYIKGLHNKSIDLNLDRIIYVAKKLNLLHPSAFVITVGGTNGKGTVCRLLEMILIKSGLTVGVYTSPHLMHYTERIRIQGKELPESVHVRIMKEIEFSRDKVTLSFFEFVTLSALKIFQEKNLKVIILEVGLGGRMDATNIINPDISVITNIALEHTDFLGGCLEKIAREKLGILRFNKPAIICEKIIPKILINLIRKIGAKPFLYKKEWFWKIKNCKTWCWWSEEKLIKGIPIPKNVSVENAAAALAVIQFLPFPIEKDHIFYSIEYASLPGRFQCIQYSPQVILDVAHNPHAALHLIEKLDKLFFSGKIYAIIGMMKDKDIINTLFVLKKKINVWCFVTLEGSRSATCDFLSYCLQDEHANKINFLNIKEAWYYVLRNANPEDCILVTGSFKSVSPILSFTKRKNIFLPLINVK